MGAAGARNIHSSTSDDGSVTFSFSRARSRLHFLLMAIFVLAASPRMAFAQDRTVDEAPTHEEPDPTRLDVERLPPEAIEVDRDLYSHGFYFEGMVGARGFQGGVGSYSRTGFYTRLGLGYELLRWLHIVAGVDGSLHSTNAPPPPAPTSYELVGAFVDLRLQANFTSHFAMWAGGEVGLSWAIGDILGLYGFDKANDFAVSFGGVGGIDWHFTNRHYSLGITGGARIFPSLVGIEGGTALGIHGGAYLRYVF